METHNNNQNSLTLIKSQDLFKKNKNINKYELKGDTNEFSEIDENI